jgi:hypothetical protein
MFFIAANHPERHVCGAICQLFQTDSKRSPHTALVLDDTTFQPHRLGCEITVLCTQLPVLEFWLAWKADHAGEHKVHVKFDSQLPLAALLWTELQGDNYFTKLSRKVADSELLQHAINWLAKNRVDLEGVAQDKYMDLVIERAKIERDTKAQGLARLFAQGEPAQTRAGKKLTAITHTNLAVSRDEILAEMTRRLATRAPAIKQSLITSTMTVTLEEIKGSPPVAYLLKSTVAPWLVVTADGKHVVIEKEQIV